MNLSILQNCFRRMSDTPRASIALHPLTAMLIEAPSSLRSLEHLDGKADLQAQ